MKTRLTQLAAFSALAFAAGLAQAQIASTPHNLGAGGSGPNHLQDSGGATKEICVFCHTPHGADTSAPAPLWNKKLPVGTAYVTYSSLNSTTLNAQFATDGSGDNNSVGSVSIACLSCHDGTQAMDNIINAPGSGGYDVTGGGADGRTGAAWNWTGSARATTQGVIGATSDIANLGTDLSNDHPIGIQYCGGGHTIAGAGSGTCTDTDFFEPTHAVLGAGEVFWVDTSVGATNVREKTDMILYNRTFAAGAGPSVECASCHDPHVITKNAANEVNFLRVSQANSGVCLACHNK